MNVPFAFARRHGVFVRDAGGAERVMVYRVSAPLAALAIACATRLDLIPTLAICSALFVLGLMSDYLFGRRA